MSFNTLIQTAELADHLGRPDWVMLDCRFSLADTAAGERQYAAAHIPGARYAHLDRDLAGPITPETGRHPLPEPYPLAHRFAAWGIGPQTQVVAYDDTGGVFAARAWWLLRWLGHTQVAVLDGGWQAWQSQGLAVTAEIPVPTVAPFVAQPRRELWLSTGQVKDGLAMEEISLLDARAPERFRGEVEPIDPVAGHIPGAENRPFNLNLGADGRFLAPMQLREAFDPIARDTPHLVHMCGSGVTACHNLLAMEIAGYRGSKLYPGSWSEWIKDPMRPVARGE
jgi:thiosulfate/3-mercaptopyruvate sulfurtransferase